MKPRSLLLQIALFPFVLSACGDQGRPKQRAFAPQPGATNIFVRRFEPVFQLPTGLTTELITTGPNEYQKRQVDFDYGGAHRSYFLVVLPDSQVVVAAGAVLVSYGGAFVQSSTTYPIPPADWEWVHTERVGASAEGSELLVRAEGTNGNGIHRVIFLQGSSAWVRVGAQPRYIWTDKAKYQEIDANLTRVERPIIGSPEVESLISNTEAAVATLGL